MHIRRIFHGLAAAALVAAVVSCGEAKADPVDDKTSTEEPAKPQDPDNQGGDDQDDQQPDGPLVSIETGDALGIATVSATISGAFTDALTEVRDYGFRYGTAADALTQEVGFGSSAPR